MTSIKVNPLDNLLVLVGFLFMSRFYGSIPGVGGVGGIVLITDGGGAAGIELLIARREVKVIFFVCGVEVPAGEETGPLIST